MSTVPYIVDRNVHTPQNFPVEGTNKPGSESSQPAAVQSDMRPSSHRWPEYATLVNIVATRGRRHIVAIRGPRRNRIEQLLI